MQNNKIKVVVAGFDGALASAITGIVDLLSLSGVSWNRIQQQHIQRLFEVKLASPDGGMIHCINGLKLHAHMAYHQIQQPDVLVIPTIGGPIEAILAQQSHLIALIRRMHQQGVCLASNCTGSFFLAEAGILNGKTATTHWGFEREFRARYPEVDLQPEQMISRDGHIYSAGGGLAWFDLGLHFIERFYSFEIAIETAKSFVIDYQRESQLSYALFRIAKPHQDLLVQQIQKFLAEHLAHSISLEDLAQQFNLTTRTLIRRFKAALDVPPNRYIQAMRMEAAQKRLEQTEQSIDQIMLAVGYQDPSSFRRLFRRHTGLSPLEYRRRFSRSVSA